MGNCCRICSTHAKAVEEPIKIEVTNMENKIEVIDQAVQTFDIIEVVYSQGPLGIKIIPDRNSRYVIIQDLIDTEYKINQTEMYNSMVPSHSKVMPGMKIVEVNRCNIGGLPYTEVLNKLRISSRPLHIGFSH